MYMTELRSLSNKEKILKKPYLSPYQFITWIFWKINGIYNLVSSLTLQNITAIIKTFNEKAEW